MSNSDQCEWYTAKRLEARQDKALICYGARLIVNLYFLGVGIFAGPVGERMGTDVGHSHDNFAEIIIC